MKDRSRILFWYDMNLRACIGVTGTVLCFFVNAIVFTILRAERYAQGSGETHSMEVVRVAKISGVASQQG